MRKLTVRRHVRNITMSMIAASILGMVAGVYFHLQPIFFLGMGVMLMLGVSLYPTRTRHHQNYRHDDCTDLE